MRTCLCFALLAGCASAAMVAFPGCSEDDAAAGFGVDGGVAEASVPGDAGPTVGSDAAATDGSTVSLAQACTDLAHARCAALDSCSNLAETVSRWGDMATCESRLAAQCLLNLAAAGTGATPATTEACAQALPGEVCADVISDVVPEVCDPVIGSLAIGSPCFSSAQCQSAYCALASSAGCGQCARVPEVGDSCKTGTDCGYQTNLGCSRGACILFLAPGQACVQGMTLCGPGVECTTTPADPDAGMAASASCVPQGSTVGAPCDPGNVVSPICDPTSGLDCTGGACADVLYAGSGAACGNLDGGVVHCAASGTCVGSVCQPAAADGALCDATNGPLCLPPARCVTSSTTGTCVLPSSSTCGP